VRDQDKTGTNAPDQDQPQTREQNQNQNREQVGECPEDAPGTDCDVTRDEAGEQVSAQFMNRIAAMTGFDAENAQYRHVFQWMWMRLIGSLHVFFF
jgi:hypothetical protein